MPPAAIYAHTDIGDWTVFMRAVERTEIPRAVRDALNTVADAVTRRQNRTIRRRLIVRTRYTLGSTTSPRARPYRALNKAHGTDLRRMFSRAGSFSPYLWLQERDSVQEGVNGPVPIPMLAARTGRSRQKAIARRYRLARSTRLGRDRRRSREIGRTSGGTVWVGVPRGMHRGRRRPFGVYERRRGNTSLRMLRSLENDRVRIRGTRFHGEAVERYGVQPFIADAYARALRRTLRRLS